MTLLRFNRSLPLFDQMFTESLDSGALLQKNVISEENWIPAINVKENEDNFDIEVAAPGFSKEDFEVTITDNILCISATNEKNTKEKEEGYSRQEFFYGAFKRTFTLPKSIDFTKKINAKYKNGVLRVHLDKLDILKGEEHKKVIEIM